MTAPAVADPAAVYYEAEASTSAQVTAGLALAWQSLEGDDIDGEWSGLLGRLLSLIIGGQLRAAAIPQAYVARVLAQDGLEPDPIGVLPPEAFAGRTAAGLSLARALDTTPIRVKQSMLRGRTLPEAMADGLAHLQMIAATEVADAGRGAMEAAIRLEPQIIGYERYVSLPACSRCVLLAGRVYRKSSGFLRHPNCDCTHRPLTSRDARDGTEQEPSELFQSLSRSEQDRIFTADGARAIRSGADLSQVVNARSGMSTPGDVFTTSGRGRRKRGKPRPARLSPQGIAREAGDDEARYLDLLRQFNYLD